MKPLLGKSSSVQNIPRRALVTLLGLFVALELALWLEIRYANQEITKDTRVAHQVRKHLSDVSFSITSYLQDHEPKTLELIKSDGQKLSGEIAAISEELYDRGASEAAQRMQKTHLGLRESTQRLLTVDQDVLKARQALDMTGDKLWSLLSQRQNSGGKTEVTRTKIDDYVRLSENVQQAEMKKNAAIGRFFLWREALERNLRESSGKIDTSRQLDICRLLIGVLLLLGVYLILKAYRHSRTELTRPLGDILQCVEAAASGDMTRIPDHWSGDEVGRLSQAIGRLISVLARSENLVYHLAALVESSGDAIISHNLDGKILSWNKGAQRIYGFSAEEMKGKSIESLARGQERVQLMRNLVRIREGGRVQPFETVHLARNGRKIQALVRVAPIFDSTRQIIGASFIAEELKAPKALAAQPTEIII